MLATIIAEWLNLASVRFDKAIIVNRINHCTILKDEIRKLGELTKLIVLRRKCYNGHGGDIMAQKSVTVQSKDTLEEVLKGEKDPEVKLCEPGQ